MSKGKILLIDDSPLVRKLAEVSLQEAGYEVFTADNGEDGLKIVEKEMPDLILVDFIMPKMTGSQFCILIKENEKFKDIPIILITGKGEAVGQAFIEKYGVQDYFIKPFKSEDLVEKVEIILGKFPPEVKKEEISIELPADEKIPEISEAEIKLIPEEETIIIETPIEKIELPFAEEVSTEIHEEKPIEFPFFEEIEESSVEISEGTFEKEIKPVGTEEEIELSLPMETELHERTSTEEGILEEIIHVAEEIVDIERTEEIKISEELVKTPVMEETQSEELTFVEEVTSESKLDGIEKIIEDKLNQFYDKISEMIKLSIESSLKKFDTTKEERIILRGKTSSYDIRELIEFMSKSNLTGLLTIFGYDIIFEFLLIEGKIVYGIASSLKSDIGGRFLRDLTTEEIKNLLARSLNILLKTKTDSFILEERGKADTYLDTLPRYNIREIV